MVRRALKSILMATCGLACLVSTSYGNNPFETCETLGDVEGTFKRHLMPLQEKVKALDSKQDREAIQTELAAAIEERNAVAKQFVRAIQKANGLLPDDKDISVRLNRTEIHRKKTHFTAQAHKLREEVAQAARTGSLTPLEVKQKLEQAEINEEIAKFWTQVCQNVEAETPFKDQKDLEEKFIQVKSWRPQTVSLRAGVTWQKFYIAKDPWELGGFILPREDSLWKKLLRPATGIIKNILLKTGAAVASTPTEGEPASTGADYVPLNVESKIIEAYGAKNIIHPTREISVEEESMIVSSPAEGISASTETGDVAQTAEPPLITEGTGTGESVPVVSNTPTAPLVSPQAGQTQAFSPTGSDEQTAGTPAAAQPAGKKTQQQPAKKK